MAGARRFCGCMRSFAECRCVCVGLCACVHAGACWREKGYVLCKVSGCWGPNIHGCTTYFLAAPSGRASVPRACLMLSQSCCNGCKVAPPSSICHVLLQADASEERRRLQEEAATARTEARTAAHQVG